MSWPEPPGPPGLMKRVALAAPSAGLRLSAKVIAGPSGLSQSNGTGMSAHWNVPQSCHEILRDRYRFVPLPAGALLKGLLSLAGCIACRSGLCGPSMRACAFGSKEATGGLVSTLS